MILSARRVCLFGSFQLDRQSRVLLCENRQVPLTPKAFDTLLALVENRARVVSKEELMQTVWPDTFVEETGLTRNISVLRKALGDTTATPRFIVTISKRGIGSSRQ